MSASNVRSIDSLEAFHDGVLGLAGDWDKTLEELRMVARRAESYFSQDRPAYWRRQLQIAQQELNEAKDQLSQKCAAIRPGERPPATEATNRVQVAKRRVGECEAKILQAKSWAIEMSQQCDSLLGPLANVVEHCEVLLPAAASELRTLIDQLRDYAEQQKRGD